MKSEYDVIIVGAGGSGLAAAVSAAEQGAAVLVLEKQAQPGGTTGIAVGSFTAAGTRQQERQNIADNVADHAVDAGLFAEESVEQNNNGELREFFLSHAAETIHWLMELGVRFHGPSPEPPNRVARMHNVIPGAKAYIATLQARLLKLGGKICTRTPVLQLNTDSSGSVVGVRAKMNGTEIDLLARQGVILAAGDYASSSELIAQHKGSDYRNIEGINPHASGDGHRMAEQVGARLLNMDITYGPELRFVSTGRRTFQQLLPAHGMLARIVAATMPLVPKFMLTAMIRRLLVTWQHPENSLFENGAILINREGSRFCNECEWPQREIAVAEQSGKEAFILLDQRLAEMFSAWPHFISTAPKIAYAYVQDYLRLRPDVAAEATELETVAGKRQIPASSLQKTVAEVNNSAQRTTPPLAGQRWVLLGPVRSWFTTTEGGAAIDFECRVLDRNGEPIPGLYAVGQNGLGGQILWGHGLHIAWAMTSGRVAGIALGQKCKIDG